MLWLRRIVNLIRRYLSSPPAFLVYGLILGSLIATLLIPKPAIALISVSGSIQQGTVGETLDAVNSARLDSRVKAVVLEIDSPGGEACAIEQIYLDLLRLRREKPVVATIGTIAASGGYYVAAATSYIYAEKASQIGSIGVWVNLPDTEELDEGRATSGLFKATGGSRRKILSWLEMLRRQFVDAIKVQRGDNLKMTEEELSRAEIYLGTEGLSYGLIDAIGTKEDALTEAAKLARIRNYSIVRLGSEGSPVMLFFGSQEPDSLGMGPRTAPVYYYLYFESE